MVRLIHDGAQPGPPLAEVLRFGAQDGGGEVHPGVAIGSGLLRFDLPLTVKGAAEAGPPVFGGAFAHGKAAERFLYLSWKRERAVEPPLGPYGWRIKIPLDGIGWEMIAAAERSGAIEADVRDRRPHRVGPVAWRVVGAV